MSGNQHQQVAKVKRLGQAGNVMKGGRNRLLGIPGQEREGTLR
jgi:hypothetical protein